MKKIKTKLKPSIKRKRGRPYQNPDKLHLNFISTTDPFKLALKNLKESMVDLARGLQSVVHDFFISLNKN